MEFVAFVLEQAGQQPADFIVGFDQQDSAARADGGGAVARRGGGAAAGTRLGFVLGKGKDIRQVQLERGRFAGRRRGRRLRRVERVDWLCGRAVFFGEQAHGYLGLG